MFDSPGTAPASPVSRFVRRRRWSLCLVGAAAVSLASGLWLVSQRLGHPAFLSGGTLFACLLLLPLIGLRRRFPMLPLGTMSTWVQVHLYTGLFALVAYLLHVPRVVADGIFEGGLSWLFLGVSASGFYGLFVSRTAPRRLTAVPGNYRFGQIGWHRQRIAELASGMLHDLQSTPAAEVLGTFYQENLHPFFTSRPGFAYVALPTGTRRRRLLAGLGRIDRYLEADTQQAAGRLAALIRMRDDLDYHFALQLRLRLWVVFHAVLSLALLLASTVHLLLVLRFAGH